ncbi:MAG: protein kinase [Myxococcales bacterium]|nr:protein kinase [Myxococcales bacterium]
MTEDSPKYFAGDVVGGKYRLTNIVGEGGMGSVWLARNLTLDADVCVKLIRRESATPKASARLLQEARAAARLNHPSIVRVFDFGETEHRDPFIVMEVLRGDSLRRLMERKARLPAANAVATLLPVASALAEAHSKGVVHRDLKPENIVLVTDESGAVIPKVVDFGIAKVRRDDLARGLTQDGSVLGSPEYMSPEQAQGRSDVDGRTDVWAVSVILYELVVGQLPFVGDNYNALLWAIQQGEPAPTLNFAAGDQELWRILKRGLAKKADERWGSMRELGAALAEWAVKNGVDVDVTGASVALSWLTAARRPLSEAPNSALRTPSIADLEERGEVAPSLHHNDVETQPERAVAKASPLRGFAIGLGVVVIVAAGALWSGRSAQLGRSAAPTASAIWPGDSAPPTAPLPVIPPKDPAQPASSVAQPVPLAASSAGGSARAQPGDGLDMACVAPVFPPATFVVGTDLSFLCKEVDPRAGAELLKAAVVKGRGAGVSVSMQEWAHLSWYELAVFAVARARCCMGAPPLVLPANGGVCSALEQVLDELGRAVVTDRAVEQKLAHFDQTVLCLLAKGGARQYAYTLARLDDARVVFGKTLERAHLAAH